MKSSTKRKEKHSHGREREEEEEEGEGEDGWPAAAIMEEETLVELLFKAESGGLCDDKQLILDRMDCNVICWPYNGSYAYPIDKIEKLGFFILKPTVI